MWQWLSVNREWLFSGVGVVIALHILRVSGKTAKRLRRAISTLPAPGAQHASRVSAANPLTVAKWATILGVHLELYKSLFLTGIKVEVLLIEQGRQLFDRLRAEDPREDLTEFWLLLVTRKVAAGRKVADIVAEHAAMNPTELRAEVAAFIVRSVVGTYSSDTAEYVQTFPPLARALDRINSETDERQAAAVQELNAFLRSRQANAAKLQRHIDGYTRKHNVDRMVVIETLAAVVRAGEKHGVSMNEGLQRYAIGPRGEFETAIDFCRRS